MAYNQPYYNGGYYPQYQNGAVPDMLGQYKGQYQQPIPQMQQNMAQPMQQNFQQMQTPPQAQPMETQKINNGFIWVQGEAGAKAYLVAPNVRIPLWDSEDMFVYIKEADGTGKMSTKKYRLVEETDGNISNSPENAPKSPTEHVCKCGNDFIPKSELNAINGKFDDISGKIEELEHKIKEMSVKPMPKTTKTTKTEE